MAATETITLSSILKPIFDRPAPLTKGNHLEVIEIRLNYAEQILKDLKEIKEYLLCSQIVSKADTLTLMKTIRKLYTYLEVYEEIESVWPDIRKGLNDSKVIFTGQDLHDRLLLNKNIIIQNRELFQVRRNLLELKNNKSASFVKTNLRST